MFPKHSYSHQTFIYKDQLKNIFQNMLDLFYLDFKTGDTTIIFILRYSDLPIKIT